MTLYADILLDSITHDIFVDNKDLVISPETADAVTQRLKIKLLFFKGEWWLNTDFGTPYYQNIFVKGVTQFKIDTIFKGQILDTQGVVSLISFESVYNPAARTYNLKFSCRSTTGDIITLEI